MEVSCRQTVMADAAIAIIIIFIWLSGVAVGWMAHRMCTHGVYLICTDCGRRLLKVVSINRSMAYWICQECRYIWRPFETEKIRRNIDVQR
jgi:hypothetical protein